MCHFSSWLWHSAADHVVDDWTAAGQVLHPSRRILALLTLNHFCRGFQSFALDTIPSVSGFLHLQLQKHTSVTQYSPEY
jgi:hypothetical protein